MDIFRRISSILFTNPYIHRDGAVLLSELPNELIQAIAHHLPTERDVDSLARVSRGFYGLLNIYLYRRNHAAEEGSERDALYWAASHARMDTFLRAEALGIPIRAPSLLNAAARRGHQRIVEFLFPRVERAAPYDHNALIMAYSHNQFHTFEFLVESGADLDVLNEATMAILHWVTLYSDLDRMRLVLDRGADVNVRGYCDWTPLHYACEQCDVAAVELLLERGAEIEAVDQALDTPMHIAAQEGGLETVKLLLARGADHRRENEIGWTPALTAVESSWRDSEAVARFLIELDEG